MRRKIPNDIWEQIKTAFFSRSFSLREIARKMDIPPGTILSHAKRQGWTQQIQAATEQLTTKQSDAITPMQSVPQSLAEIMSERKERTKLGLSKYTAEAAEEAAEHGDKLGIARNVRDAAAVHSTLWPAENQPKPLINLAVLIGDRRAVRKPCSQEQPKPIET